MLFTYTAFSLRLHTNVALPGLLPATTDASADLTIIRLKPPEPGEAPKGACTPELEGATGEQDVRVIQEEKFIRLCFPGSEHFTLDRQGTHIDASWPAGVALEEAATLLLGPVMSAALRLRGLLCLHGSAVVIDGRAIALLGPHGAGKSTTAAAFVQRGFPLLTDDLLALAGEETPDRVLPGYLRLRLWPESVAHLFGSPQALPRITPPDGADPAWDKRFLTLDADGGRFCPAATPLAAIYLLRRDDSFVGRPSITPLRGHAALTALVAHTHDRLLPDMSVEVRELELLSRLLRRTVVRRVQLREDFGGLDELCAAIAADVRALPAPHTANDGEGTGRHRQP